MKTTFNSPTQRYQPEEAEEQEKRNRKKKMSPTFHALSHLIQKPQVTFVKFCIGHKFYTTPFYLLSFSIKPLSSAKPSLGVLISYNTLEKVFSRIVKTAFGRRGCG